MKAQQNNAELDSYGAVLVVGRNSRLWPLLRPSFEHQLKGRRLIVCSSRDIYDLSETLLGQNIERAFVLSYAPNIKDNQKLLKNLRLLTPKLVYVSTLSVNAALEGYPYKYPFVKYATERLCKAPGFFDKVRILRLGLVEGTYSESKVAGKWHHTGLDALAVAGVRAFGSARFDFEVVTEVRFREFDSKTEDYAFRLYGRLLRIGPVMGTILRPVDVALKLLGWNWYGYHQLANRSLFK
ncbi:MAG: hypothetical protein AAGD96_10590 [Chloroflexota bacterium]